jgi:hypothetical protein
MTELEQKVADAAEKLVREGRNVTGESVRTEIGGGSLRDVCPALRRWRASKATAEASAIPLPEEVASAFQQAAHLAWAAAERLACDQIAAMQAACKEKVSLAETERDEAMADLSRVELRLDQVGSELSTVREQSSKALAALARAEAQEEAALSKIGWLERALDSEKRSAAQALDMAAELRGRIAVLSDSFDLTRKRLGLARKLNAASSSQQEA